MGRTEPLGDDRVQHLPGEIILSEEADCGRVGISDASLFIRGPHREVEGVGRGRTTDTRAARARRG